MKKKSGWLRRALRRACACCGDSITEGYSITLTLCHDCMTDLEQWLEQRKRGSVR